jgi:hypothetical protein
MIRVNAFVSFILMLAPDGHAAFGPNGLFAPEVAMPKGRATEGRFCGGQSPSRKQGEEIQCLLSTS